MDMLGVLLDRGSRSGGDRSATSPPAVPRTSSSAARTLAQLAFTGHRPLGPGARAQGPGPPKLDAARASPSRHVVGTETIPRELLVKTPIGIDDPLSSPYGMSPKQSDGRPVAAGRH